MQKQDPGFDSQTGQALISDFVRSAASKNEAKLVTKTSDSAYLVLNFCVYDLCCILCSVHALY
jgi:hypothetical protein